MPAYPFHYDLPRVAPADTAEVTIQRLCRDAVSKVFDAQSWSIPNAGKRTRWAATRAKLEGLHAGAPDLLIIGGKRNPGKVAFVEIKAGKHLSEAQHETLTALVAAAHDCGVFRSPGSLVDKMREWGWQ